MNNSRLTQNRGERTAEKRSNSAVSDKSITLTSSSLVNQRALSNSLDALKGEKFKLTQTKTVAWFPDRRALREVLNPC